MNKIYTAFLIQALTSTSTNTKIQTIALYSTVKDKKCQVPNLTEKTESNCLFLFSLLTLLLLAITLSSFHSIRWEIWTVNVNTTMQQKASITLSENATKTAKTSWDHSCVKALFTEACKQFNYPYVPIIAHTNTPVNSCSRSGTLTGGLKHLRLLVTLTLSSYLPTKRVYSNDPSYFVVLNDLDG